MDGTGFGLPLDANTVYSGQVQSNLVRKFGIVGAASGGSALWRL